jgi:hypothetical protein
LLTTSNPLANDDMMLFKRLGIHPENRTINDDDEPRHQISSQHTPAYYDATATH